MTASALPLRNSGARDHRRRTLGLRSRAALAAAIATLLVAAALSSIAWFASQSYLTRQRETSGADGEEAIGFVRSEPGGLILLRSGGTWFSAGVGVGPSDLPPSIIAAVDEGRSGHQLVDIAGRTRLVVVVALIGEASYVEIFGLDNLRDTLGVLGWSLIVGSLLTATAGGLLGVWTTRRALRPLTATADVATRIAGGDLEERLDDDPDPDLARLAQAFNGMAEVLLQRLEQESRFASDVSHELRTPVATLTLAAASLERRRDELSERNRQALDLVTGGLRDLERLVEELLELARAAGSPSGEFRPEPFAELIRAIVAHRAGPDVPVVVTSPTLEGLVPVDRRRLERVLANVIENAERYAGGVTSVTLVDRRAGGRVAILVDDHGPGISEEDLGAIFQRFVRGRSTQDIPGSGLGLSLVQTHVEAMGGSVQAENLPAGGTRFTIELPRVPPEPLIVEEDVP
jgi:two-component system sensor histidine kinase MtrB